MELVKNIKQSIVIKRLFIALIGTIILAISSKVKIPFYPVPMTMQTFVVLLIGITLGWKMGVATVSLYLFEGMIGLPIFSGTPEKGILILEEIAKIIVPIKAKNTFLTICDCVIFLTVSIYI